MVLGLNQLIVSVRVNWSCCTGWSACPWAGWWDHQRGSLPGLTWNHNACHVCQFSYCALSPCQEYQWGAEPCYLLGRPSAHLGLLLAFRTRGTALRLWAWPCCSTSQSHTASKQALPATSVLFKSKLLRRTVTQLCLSSFDRSNKGYLDEGAHMLTQKLPPKLYAFYPQIHFLSLTSSRWNKEKTSSQMIFEIIIID